MIKNDKFIFKIIRIVILMALGVALAIPGVFMSLGAGLSVPPNTTVFNIGRGLVIFGDLIVVWGIIKLVLVIKNKKK